MSPDSPKNAPKIRVTLTKSLIGRPDKQRKVAKALGLTKTQDIAFHHDTPIIRGMIRKISHLLTVEAA